MCHARHTSVDWMRHSGQEDERGSGVSSCAQSVHLGLLIFHCKRDHISFVLVNGSHQLISYWTLLTHIQEPREWTQTNPRECQIMEHTQEAMFQKELRRSCLHRTGKSSHVPGSGGTQCPADPEAREPAGLSQTRVRNMKRASTPILDSLESPEPISSSEHRRGPEWRTQLHT